MDTALEPSDPLVEQITSYRDTCERIGNGAFVPSGLMDGAPSFGLGQALVGGRIFPRGCAYVQMGDRLTQEGGADVPTTWARPRSS